MSAVDALAARLEAHIGSEGHAAALEARDVARANAEQLDGVAADLAELRAGVARANSGIVKGVAGVFGLLGLAVYQVAPDVVRDVALWFGQ